MKSDLNLVMMIGVVHKEPWTSPTNNQLLFLQIQNTKYKTKPSQERVSMIAKIGCYRELANYATSLRIGDRILITGTLSLSKYQDKKTEQWVNDTTIWATTIEKLVKKDEEKEDDLFNQPQVDTDNIPF